MDRERFDELARLLATKGSRRSTLAALLSVAILGHDPDDADAKPGKSKGKAKAKRNGHDKGRGKGHDKGKGQGHTETEEPVDVQPEELRAAPESDEAPEVQAEAQGGGGRGKKKAKGRGKSKGKGRNKKQSGSRTSQAQAEATRCCGTNSCALPTAGSNRYECNFAGQNLSGRNMTGVNFGRIDGRGTNFSNANVRGANFGEACLQGANFRGADVSSTNFGKACLFFADFTGARNLNVSVNFSTALLCGTILADGTVSDRDCGRATACCAACDAQRPCTNGQICCNGRCVTGQCCTAGNCEDRVCQTKTCVGNQCQYSPVTGGTCPISGGANGTCCGGVCCAANQVCDTRPNPDVCCTPQTRDQTCGVGSASPKCGSVINNCGQTVNCGPCAPQTCKTGTCNAQNTCDYANQPNGQPGTNCNTICCNGNCCTGGQVCFQNSCCTPDSNTCQGKCGSVTNNCGQTVNCGPCAEQICKTGSCNAQNTCDYSNQPNRTTCTTATGQTGICCGGQCVAGGQCCAVDDCTAQQCRSVECTGNRCVYTVQPNGPGTQCAGPGEQCCGGVCCTPGQVCNTGPNPDVCCTPESRETTCAGKCGNVTNNCGQVIECGACTVQTCKTGVCGSVTPNICTYTNQPSGAAGNNCLAPLVCCEGVCCTTGQVCNTTANPDVCCTPTKTTCVVGVDCGNVSDGCGGTINCGTCPVVTCNTTACTNNICVNTLQPSGAPGTNCNTVCCEGTCCTAGQVCNTGPNPDVCCTPDTFNETCEVGTPTPKCGPVTNNCGVEVNCGACAALTCRTVVCNGTTDECDYTIQGNGAPGTNCTTQCCNGFCCPSGTTCQGGQCVGPTCGSQTCDPDDEICCGNQCVSNQQCCEINQGCNPGTCCEDLICIPVSNPAPNDPNSTCQICCQNGPQCRDFFDDPNWVCVGDPKFCAGTSCPTGKCCRPKQCNNNNDCGPLTSGICCDGACCSIGQTCNNQTGLCEA